MKINYLKNCSKLRKVILWPTHNSFKTNVIFHKVEYSVSGGLLYIFWGLQVILSKDIVYLKIEFDFANSAYSDEMLCYMYFIWVFTVSKSTF